MANRSPRFGLTTFDQDADRLDFENWKFGVADRLLLDRLLTAAVEHAHDGREVVATAPAAPRLTPYSENGSLPAGTTVYYRYSMVDDRGQDQIASAMAVAHTPTQIFPPVAPTLVRGAGVAPGYPLLAGIYQYAVSAYTGTTVQETQTSPVAMLVIPSLASIILTLPPLPSGANGFNVYRQGPLENEMTFLASTASTTTFVDDGTQGVDRLRRVPSINTTRADNSIEVLHPEGGLGGLGWSWKIYRTFDPSDWADSLLEWTTSTVILDVGMGTNEGTPPLSSAATGSADSINLTDVAEIEGTLPPGFNVVLEEIVFELESTLPPDITFPPVTFTDDFDRAAVDEVPVAAPWLPMPWYPQLDLISDHLQTGWAEAAAVIDAGSVDVELEATFDGTIDVPGIIVSHEELSNSWLTFFINGPTGDWSVDRIVGGFLAETVASGNAGAPWTAPVTIAVVAAGDTYDLRVDGMLMWSGSDDTYVRTSTQHGVYVSSPSMTVEAFSYSYTPDPISTQSSSRPFVCEWDRCELFTARAWLTSGSPDTQDMQVTVEKLAAGETIWEEVTSYYDRPTIDTIEQIGQRHEYTLPLINSVEQPTFAAGDAMRVTLIQDAGVPTTAAGLTASLFLFVQGGSATETHVWETS